MLLSLGRHGSLIRFNRFFSNNAACFCCEAARQSRTGSITGQFPTHSYSKQVAESGVVILTVYIFIYIYSTTRSLEQEKNEVSQKEKSECVFLLLVFTWEFLHFLLTLCRRSIHPSIIYQSIHPFACLSIHPSIHPSNCLFIHPSIHPFLSFSSVSLNSKFVHIWDEFIGRLKLN